MKKQIKIPEVVGMITSVLEKSRDALSKDDVQVLEKAIEALKKLEEAEPEEINENVGAIAINLLKFFTKSEILEQLMDWFNN